MKKINLTISTPCHENWNNMTSEAKGRFCDSCQKTVVDFTGMSDGQLAQFFKKPAGEVCGRLHADQMDRDLTIPAKRIPWARYFFQFTIPAFLFSLKAGAQRSPGKTALHVVTLPLVNQPTMGMIAMAPPEQKKPVKYSGCVRDPEGKPIQHATVISRMRRIQSLTDSTGRFSIRLPEGDTTLHISALGYQPIEIKAGSHEAITMQPLLQGFYLGKISSFVPPVTKAKKVPLMKPLKDSVSARFTVFPNPATAGSLVTISFHDAADMPESLALYTTNGRLVMSSPLAAAKKALVFNLRLPAGIASGTYLLQLKNHNAAKSAALGIVVE